MIFLACFTTVLIEVPYFIACGYRKRDEIISIACANIITNIVLNLLISYVFHNELYCILLSEIAVVAVECWIYSIAFQEKTLQLLLNTLGANCLSFGIGLLLFS